MIASQKWRLPAQLIWLVCSVSEQTTCLASGNLTCWLAAAVSALLAQNRVALFVPNGFSIHLICSFQNTLDSSWLQNVPRPDKANQFGRSYQIQTSLFWKNNTNGLLAKYQTVIPRVKHMLEMWSSVPAISSRRSLRLGI